MDGAGAVVTVAALYGKNCDPLFKSPELEDPNANGGLPVLEVVPKIARDFGTGIDFEALEKNRAEK